MKIFIAFVLAVLFFSCRQESFTNSADALLITSVDTLHFDTVFTTAGSITQAFKILNNNTKGIHINSVQLGGGSSSPFKINVNGQPGSQISNIDISGNDSAYVFVSVSINPTSVNLPFVVRDSIAIEYNGNKEWVQLEAYGQNAHFFKNRIITGNETWTNDLPYVILDKLIIDTNSQLTITKGCKIYIHADAPVIVNGTLQAMGEKYDSTRITFTGDRLDDPYRDFPGSWPGIIFNGSSKNNIIEYGTIKNAYQAIGVLGSAANTTPKLTLNQTIIDNAYDAGLIGVNASITAQNLLVSNCGKNMILQGGTYQFTHCTVASYTNYYLQHKDPVLFINNTADQLTGVNSLNATFKNCIFWGEGGLVDNEVVVEKSGNLPFNVLFDHVLWKETTTPSDVTINEPINNVVPEFDSINTFKSYYSFRLAPTSPAINKGVNTGLNIDLDGNLRPVDLPDLGCYERQ